MTFNKERVIGFCDEIIGRGLNIKWQTPNGIRASVTDSEMLSKMKSSGCLHITLAPETGSERVLKEVVEKGKDFDLTQLKDCGALAHDLGLKVAAYFIIGLPGETKKSFVEGVRKVIDSGVWRLTIYTLMMLYGTEFKNPSYRNQFKMKGKYRIVPLNLGEYDGVKIFDYEEVCIKYFDHNNCSLKVAKLKKF